MRRLCCFDKAKKDIFIGNDPENVDGLNFLEGKSMATSTKKHLRVRFWRTPTAVSRILSCVLPIFSEQTLGYLIYFFEKACAISGYLMGVNPFDQPGVESYKKNMFALLGKPGYESEKEALESVSANKTRKTLRIYCGNK